jgi:hypothetical protein
MTKAALVLCAIIMLTGCPSDQAPQSTTSPGKEKGTAGIRGKGGSGKDFHIVDKGGFLQVTVYDAGFSVIQLDCLKNAACPSNKSIPLIAGWTMDVIGTNNGTGTPTKVMTISSADNLTIVSNYFVSDVDTAADGSNDTNTGTDLIQSEYTLASANLTNGDKESYTVTCKSSCKLRIVYHHP